MQSAGASGTSTGAERRGTNERPTPPELPYAACFAAVSGAQSRENEASCAGARPAAVYVYSKRSRYAQIARCRGRATLRRNMPHVDTAKGGAGTTFNVTCFVAQNFLKNPLRWGCEYDILHTCSPKRAGWFFENAVWKRVLRKRHGTIVKFVRKAGSQLLK